MENNKNTQQSALSKFMDFAKANPFTAKVIITSVVSSICSTIVAVAEAFASRKD